ncbi:protein of unknown function DUF1173 [Acidovorax delafieldii 2AN]|uniref:DUF1173 domain-containing protein n=1 Tax=Acidovorax delafieldii 2AN TaxID=573060 RepID=C5T019_ACIDE|nr:DUF1173 domain-containing protein [Acidovorax delafieldii]EER62127.1 protein of unknown function DUF1173 [Acidovorax delafieldii 2AN]
MGGATTDLSPDVQRFAIRGRIWQVTDPGLQDALAQIHDSAERPRCLCTPDGIEMYVARHRQYLVKRMPDTGKSHHPLCPSYEPDNAYSGLGDLMGDAVLETHPGHIELRVDFPWTRIHGRAVARGEPDEPGEVSVPRKRMTLRAVMHFLFEQAGFNRWTPAMAGKRNQGVLCKYLLEAAADIEVKGKSLAERLYVPEPFSEPAKADIAQRRRAKLAVLQPHGGQAPLALVIGEFKACERSERGCRIWIRHMPDAPLLMDTRAWDRLARTYAAMLEARDADTGHPARLIMAALIHARREFTYEIDAASLMLVSEQWIPVDGVHELPLIDGLIAQKRRFLKPLRYDAKAAAAFPNALLLDCGAAPIPLHLTSEFMSPKDRVLKEKAIHTNGNATVWHWHTALPIPPLPPKTLGQPL